jgi:SAM-dependent methyltransferase
MPDYLIGDQRDAVSDIYRAILRRDPDPEGMSHFAAMLGKQGLREVIEQFLASREYRALSAPGFNERLNWGLKMPVELNLSDAQLDQLWDHVSQVWTRLGISDPFWSVLTSDRYRKANINDATILEEFYASGVSDLDYLRAYLSRADVALTPDMVVAEYGCGVGRVTPFLARVAGRVLAFDISATHLDAARKRLEREDVANVELVHMKGRSSLERLRAVDLFFSIIVLQHNPPPIMLNILDAAFAGLRPGGLAFFQVPIYASDYAFEFSKFMEKEGRARLMEMHFLPQADILRLARAHDMQLLEIRTDHMIGNFADWVSNTFLIRKQ